MEWVASQELRLTTNCQHTFEWYCSMSLFAIGYCICTSHALSTARIDSGICHPHVIYMDNCSCSFKYKAFYVHPSCHEFHILWCQLCHVTFCPKGLVTLGHKYCLSTIGSPNFKTYPFLLFKKMIIFNDFLHLRLHIVCTLPAVVVWFCYNTVTSTKSLHVENIPTLNFR